MTSLIDFKKYQATGNDFILIDDRDKTFPTDLSLIPRLCDRRFGIGSDGLILIQPHETADFTMVFYNPDTSQSLCGNGSRCAVMFAHHLGMIGTECQFMAYDGMHEATILSDLTVRLRMQDVQDVSMTADGMLLDTGSPHLIQNVDNLDTTDVVSEGKRIRFSEPFRKAGVNVNFVTRLGDSAIGVRTYERGVENETLSCGTGVTAAALSASFQEMGSPISIHTRGGDLQVEFQADHESGHFSQVYLTGPAKYVFSGQIELKP